MLGDIVKILADEPERIEKAILKAIKILFSILIAAFLYKRVIGPFYLIQLSDYEKLVDYLLSGRVLICLLFYFISGYMIIPLINQITYVLALFISKYRMKFDKKDYWKILKLLDIIRFEKDTRVPLPGKNIDVLYNFSKTFKEESVKDEVDSLKDTFIQNVVNLYSVFIILYFVLIDSGIRSSVLNFIVIAGLILVFLLNSAIHRFFEYMIRNYQIIVNSLIFIKSEYIIKNVFKQYDIFLLKPPNEENLSKGRLFHSTGKEFILFHSISDRKLRTEEVTNLLEKNSKKDRVYIIIVNKEFIDNSQSQMLDFHDNLIFIEYSDDKNLEAQLKQTIENIIR